MRRGHLMFACFMVPVMVTGVFLLILIRRTTVYQERVVKPKYDSSEFTEFTTIGRRQENGTRSGFTEKIDPNQYPWAHLYYGYFRRQLFEVGTEKVSRSIAAGHEISEVRHVLGQAARLLQETGRVTSREVHCVGGRVRYLPGLGVQYEMYLRDHVTQTSPDRGADDSASDTDVPSPELSFHTVRLQRPLGDLQVEYVGRTSNQLIHIVLPYYHRAPALQKFLAQFVRLAKVPQPVTLTVVRFSRGLPAMSADEEVLDRQQVDELVGNASQSLQDALAAPVTLLQAGGAFSAGKAWLQALEATAEDGIVMLAHVDLLFGEPFLQRCRANTAPGRMAYYPVVFSTYNPHVAYGVFKRKVHTVLENYESGRLLRPELGYWLDSDYSVSCQYASDFRRFTEPFAGNFGHELDIMLYERYVKSSVEVIRMPDPNLIQVYHKVTCLREMGKDRYNACLKTKASNEASKLEWGLWVYKTLGDTDDIAAFLEAVSQNGLELPQKDSVLTANATTDT